MKEEKWREAVRICGRILADRTAFEKLEINYKLVISEKVKELYVAVEEGEEFARLLKKAFSRPNNLTNRYAHNPFIEWATEHQDDAREALLKLVDTRHTVANRVNRFLELVPLNKPSGPGTRLTIASFLLMGYSPDKHPMYRTTDYATVEGVLGWEVPPGISPGDTYSRHRAFLNRLLARLRQSGQDARGFLDAQSLVYILASSDDPDIVAWREEDIVNDALERAMTEFENEADPEFIRQHQERFDEARQRFDTVFGTPEAIEKLTPAAFVNFFDGIDARGRTGAGLFTPGLPFPKNPETQAYRRLVEDMPALRRALIGLLHGEGGLAERVDRMLEGPRVRTYITNSLPVPSMLLCFQNPEDHAGVQQMHVKEAKIEAIFASEEGSDAGPALEDEDLLEIGGISVGESFEVDEYILASLPSDHGRDWNWAQRNLFYFSEAFRRNLEADPLTNYVERFYEERGYPTVADEDHMLVREEFASYVDEDAVMAPNWRDFRRIFNSSFYGRTGPQSRLNSFMSTATDEGLESLRLAVAHLLYSDESMAQCLDDILEGAYRVPGLGESVATKLLAVCYPEEVLPVFVTVGPSGKEALMRHEALGLELPQASSRGETAERTNDLLRDRLKPYFGNDTFAMKEFLYWLHRLAEKVDEKDGESKRNDFQALADSLLLDPDFFEDVTSMLREKGQVIFYGPPGTGKTFVARALARHLAGQLSRYEVVQFHPSYSYEDFVQGYRPVRREDGSLAYELKHGPLMRLAYAAMDAPGRDHVLLVDEINRGNLPKILGELLYLLEYREEEVALMYGEDGERFKMPENLFIVGTMNTADRSIALVDAALRRRFHFVPFFPSEYPLEGLLSEWLARHKSELIDVVGVADIVARLNARLRDRFVQHLQVGPSYFMRDDLSEKVLESVWKHDIMPFLEDQLFGHEEELAGFALDELRKEGSANS